MVGAAGGQPGGLQVCPGGVAVDIEQQGELRHRQAAQLRTGGRLRGFGHTV
ncbi:MAG: hypothetical protein ACRDCY_22055 [Aeromonas veronii]